MNHLPQATALQITAADLVPKVDRTTLQRRLFPTHSGPRGREEAKPVPHVLSDWQPREWTGHHDQHVEDWRTHLAQTNEQPLEFLRRRCRELSVRYSDVVGKSLTRLIVPYRHQLIVEMKTKYPRLSLNRIGRLVGGRDHATILFVLKKMNVGYAGQVRIEYFTPTVREMFTRGDSFADIGKNLGYTGNGISAFVKRMGWQR